MKRTQLVALCVCVMFAAVMGCRGGGQIYQVKDVPVQTAGGKPASMEDVQKAIIAAGAGLGWIMVPAKPGEITGTLNIRSHQAIVSIPYTTENYSILYKESTNLKYDAENQTIHRNYQGWIQNLDNAIKRHLALLGT